MVATRIAAREGVKVNLPNPELVAGAFTVTSAGAPTAFASYGTAFTVALAADPGVFRVTLESTYAADGVVLATVRQLTSTADNSLRVINAHGITAAGVTGSTFDLQLVDATDTLANPAADIVIQFVLLNKAATTTPTRVARRGTGTGNFLQSSYQANTPKTNMPGFTMIAGSFAVASDGGCTATSGFDNGWSVPAAAEAAGVYRVTLANTYATRPLLFTRWDAGTGTADNSLHCIDGGVLTTAGTSSAAPTAGLQFDVGLIDGTDTLANPAATGIVHFLALFANAPSVGTVVSERQPFQQLQGTNVPSLRMVAGQFTVHTDSVCTISTTPAFASNFTVAKKATGVFRVTLEEAFGVAPVLLLSQRPAGTGDYSFSLSDGGQIASLGTVGTTFDIQLTNKSVDTLVNPGTTGLVVSFLALFNNSGVV